MLSSAASTCRILLVPLGKRSFSSTNTSAACPFHVLGIPRSSTHEEVKKAFKKLALKHHPDTTTNKSDANGQIYWKIREALETILAGNDSQNENHLAQWFHDETGLSYFYMTAATRNELTHVANNMSPGGLDRGGMWEMARTIARQQQQRGGSLQEDPLQLTQGKDSNEKSCIQRRRQRKS